MVEEAFLEKEHPSGQFNKPGEMRGVMTGVCT
jgi:hypothetical protein